MAWVIGISIGLFFLFKFPRPTLTLAGILVVAGYCLWYFNVHEPEQRKEKLKKQVKVIAEYDVARCKDEAFPLAVTISNGSKARLLKVHWTMDINKPGHSSDLAGYDRYFESDHILNPGDGFVYCYGLPRSLDKSFPVSSLQYAARGVWVEAEGE